jgi:hypothetical protein
MRSRLVRYIGYRGKMDAINLTPEERQRIRDRVLYGLIYNHIYQLEAQGVEVPEQLISDAKVLELLSGSEETKDAG